jgi:MoaA/NifB/PqqE/SkfB family radical SAM enzyme
MLEIHKKKSLNIDIGNRCTLQCSECVRTKFVAEKIPLPKNELTISQFDKISNFFAGKEIHFCGSFSDPIFNPDFIKMLAMCKEKNISAVVHTAASHKPESWYLKAFDANIDAQWIFGIDGLPQQSSIYRKNQDGEKLFNIMLNAKSLGVPVVWQYIIFDYNQKSVNKAKKIASKNKLTLLFVNTTRNKSVKNNKK